ncbi:hypothetical protein BCR42DRAFT_398833 [Absidia repens]|uniref:Uncharacterized protein n=1 Tax=Absidia repens TaxID=90262 RepID=A0A1X2HRD8_9FUNG|nr:hypothetical protein BCR42DRAFT_398833 [Absidia repens]
MAHDELSNFPGHKFDWCPCRSLLQPLPTHANPHLKCSKSTIISRYILPALQPLFDDHEHNIRFEFTSTDLADTQRQSSGFCWQTRCYPHHVSAPIQMTALIQLGPSAACHLWGKRQSTKKGVMATLAIHVVDGLYTMAELTRVQCPMSVFELPAYLTYFSQLKNRTQTPHPLAVSEFLVMDNPAGYIRRLVRSGCFDVPTDIDGVQRALPSFGYLHLVVEVLDLTFN